eukprot:SAG22_NODE_7277_length_755_cov_1.236280_3_plen_47_part_01
MNARLELARYQDPRFIGYSAEEVIEELIEPCNASLLTFLHFRSRAPC